MPWQLVRLDPPERRGEVLTLDDARGLHLLGRSQQCDLPLHTATASRRHAELRRRDDGVWTVEAAPGKSLLIDGEPASGACELFEGSSLVLGGDRLRCRRVDRVDSERSEAPGDASEASSPAPSPRWKGAAMLLICLAIVAILRFVWGA